MKQIVFLLLCFASLLVKQNVECTIKLKGVLDSLKQIGSNFATYSSNTFELDNLPILGSMNLGVLGAYWRSNSIAGASLMKDGDAEGAMEAYRLSIATLTTFDIGQSLVYPFAEILLDKVILKYQNDFKDTLDAFKGMKQVMQSDLLEISTKVSDSKILQLNLNKVRSKIVKAFDNDVLNGMSKFIENTAIYGSLVDDLKGIKTWAKVLKWGDVFLGPLFDAAAVGIGVWQLDKAIADKDPFAIASNSLGLVSGLVGIASFAAGALATAGSTLALVAGPVGAIVGAVLGITSIVIEMISSFNPYTRIDGDLKFLRELTNKSKEFLNADIQTLTAMMPGNQNFSTFSAIYGMNQGMALELIRGRADDYNVPVMFNLPRSEIEENGYLVVGESNIFDKSKYPDNLFWNPEGVEKLGYDFYGKKLKDDFSGVTVIADTKLIAGRENVIIKGIRIKTFNSNLKGFGDNVVIGDMYDMVGGERVEVSTGGGDDVIVMSGLIGQPGNKDYDHREAMIVINTVENVGLLSKKKENNLLSLEAMSKDIIRNKAYTIKGVKFCMDTGEFYYILKNNEKKYWGSINGIRIFVGSPFDDTVFMDMNANYVVRQMKGWNRYTLKTTTWNPFFITIDDQSDTAGTLSIVNGHRSRGIVKTTDLVYDKSTRTLFIYGFHNNQWIVRGKIFFNRRKTSDHIIKTEADGMEVPLKSVKDVFEPIGVDENIDVDRLVNYKFDRNIRSGECRSIQIRMIPPTFEMGHFKMYFFMRKNVDDILILSNKLIEKCMKNAKREFVIARVGYHSEWEFRLFSPDGSTSPHCIGKDHDVDISDFEKLYQEMPNGKIRLLVDLYRDRRTLVSIKQEINKIDEKVDFHFNSDLQRGGKITKPYMVYLRRPGISNPVSGTVVTSIISLNAKKIRTTGSIVYTEELRKWLNDTKRKLMLEMKSNEWHLLIKRNDNLTTHRVDLRNVNSIEYVNNGETLRQPIVDLQEMQNDSINVEIKTQQMLARYSLMYKGQKDCP